MLHPIVDIHIEKTAGRSKRKTLVENFGPEQVLHYDCSIDKVMPAGNRLIVTENPLQEKVQNMAANRFWFPFIKAGYVVVKALEARKGIAPEDIGSDFTVVTGHLTGDRFEGIISPEDSTYTTVLRDPLARARSHYEHWRRTRGLARFRFMPKFDPDMAFEDFALQPEMQNYQTTAIGIDPERLSLIGVAEILPQYLQELGLQVGSEGVPHINKSDYPSEPNLSAGFVSEFEGANVQDYELYEQTRAEWANAQAALILPNSG